MRYLLPLAFGFPRAAQDISASLRTGFLSTTATNSKGFFSFPDLQPGACTLTLSADGLRGCLQPVRIALRFQS